MLPKSIKQISVDGLVWGAALSEEQKCMYLEVRKEEKQSITIARLEPQKLKIKPVKADLEWWDRLVGARGEELYFVKYLNQNDPTQRSFFCFDFKSKRKSNVDMLPSFDSAATHPDVYEHGSDFFKTVSDFLSLELPLSCEYLEWRDKIIISYYLRSGNGFDRYLLLINQGEKEWKVKQDEQMKGFSPGAFFVFEHQLIFIKDRNEVCVYTG